MLKKLGYAIFLISVSLVFINVAENSLSTHLNVEAQSRPKLQGNWEISERGSEQPNFTKVGEIRFKKERNGEYSGIITQNTDDSLPSNGTVANINYDGSRLTFEVRYNNSKSIDFELSVDGRNKFYGTAGGHTKLGGVEARLVKK